MLFEQYHFKHQTIIKVIKSTFISISLSIIPQYTQPANIQVPSGNVMLNDRFYQKPIVNNLVII